LGTRFHLTYFDAFAGTGDIPLGEPLPLFDGLLDVESVIEGSVTRALNLPKPFNRYILVDKRRANIRSLEALKESYADLSDRIQLVKDDANVAIAQFCDQDFRPKSGQRAIIFLDPFGNQVGWETLKKSLRLQGSIFGIYSRQV
jgi:three-Cys-motif partner protein